jgi:hypothetical protein
MKKLFIISLLGVLTLTAVQAQQSRAPQKSPVYYVGKLHLSITHTTHDLQLLNKSMLSKVYKRRVLTLMELLPYMALKIPPGKHIEDLDMPPITKNRVKDAKKQEKIRKSFFKNLDHTMLSINPNADKEDLIEMISLLDLLIVRVNEFIQS